MSVSDQILRAPRAAPPAKKARTAERKRRPVSQEAESIQPISLERLKKLAGYLIRQAQLWVFQDFNETLAPLDIRPVQYSILTVIRENPGLSQMALSQVLGIVRSGVVPMLDGLESRKLLRRAASVSDRRSHALHLTAEGNALLNRADALVQQHERRLIAKVGPRGHKQLLEILKVFGKRD
ncbi:MAG: MarR family transcriptional regulator [Bradyrhizobium sp.]|nr:MarR family transcriptional regulator [Bradyrhizobium sp.]